MNIIKKIAATNISLGPKQVLLDRGPWRLDDGGHSHLKPGKLSSGSLTKAFQILVNDARSMKKDWKDLESVILAAATSFNSG